MEPWMIAILLKPFAFLFVAVFIMYPVRIATIRYMPEGKLKRFLLISWR